MTEIGSEFWSIPTAQENHLFPNETYWFISGRSALLAILKENKFKTAAVPMWCCDSMLVPFLNCGISVQFYSDELPETDVALVMDYFGYTRGSVNIDNFNGVLIRDITHSVFSKEYNDADYYFGSLRKWAGFATGGFAWGFTNTVQYENDNSNYVELRKQAMDLKRQYIAGQTDNKNYLEVFSKAENLLEDVRIFPADDEDIASANNLDVSYIKNRRRNNARVLLDAFKNLAVFPKMGDNDCPLFVPIRVYDRDGLRRYLIDKQIYCPVHWSLSQHHNVNDEYNKLYAEELSLVCDQRYTENDMMRIVDAIHEYYLKEKQNA